MTTISRIMGLWLAIAGSVGPVHPGPQLAVPVRIVEVYDGDTITCEIKFRARVRLLECWAPELRNPGGRESRDHLARHALGKRGVVVVDLSDVDRLDDVLTFGRLLAKVWVENNDLSTLQVRSGHATARKQPPRPCLSVLEVVRALADHVERLKHELRSKE